MYGVFVLGSAVAVTVCSGFYLSRKGGVSGAKSRGVLLGAMVFLFAMLCLSAMPVLAAETAAGAAADGADAAASGGLRYIGAGLAIGLACIGAGLAVGYVGAAALGIVGEKPDLLGKTLIYLGLAEGIAVYGIVISILILMM